METTQELFDGNIKSVLHKMAVDGVNHSVDGLSIMVGETLTSTDVSINLVPILDIPTYFGGPETEVIGVYLRGEGQMAGQFMLIMPIAKALELVDMLMFEAPGTTKELDGMGRSALAEVGNLTGTFFLNALATMTGLETKPTPPAVMFDMVGAILNVIVATSAETVDQVVTITAAIMHGDREVRVHFWYIPEPSALDAFTRKVMKG